MGFWKRLMRLLKANAEAVVEAAEDPEVIVGHLVGEMRMGVHRATEAAGMAVASRKGLERQIKAKSKEAGEWEAKAEAALKYGREDLARTAMERVPELERAVEELRRVHAEQGAVEERTRGNLVKMRARLDEAILKRDVIVARCRAAEARKIISEAMCDTTGDAFDAFGRLVMKVEGMEASAEIAGEVSGQAVKDEFAAMTDSQEVGRRIEALKQKVSNAGL